MRPAHTNRLPDSAAGRALRAGASMDINFERPRVDGWTPELVERHVVDAAMVLHRLPPAQLQAYFSIWPHVAVEFGDLVSQTPEPMGLRLPSAAAISRMEATLGWIAWLEPIDSKIVWMRASGERWKSICWTIGLARAAARQGPAEEHRQASTYCADALGRRRSGNQPCRHFSQRRIRSRGVVLES